MENKYINPDNPVYISYSWSNAKHPDLEKNVNAMCAKMEDANILYLRDKGDGDHRLIEYRKRIKNSEEQIGDGNAVLIFLSKKYFQSLHCLYELHCILGKKDFANRIFPIVLNDFPNLFDEKDFGVCIQVLTKRYEKYYSMDLLDEELNESERAIVEHKGYIEDFKTLRTYLHDHMLTIKPEDYDVVISQLIEQVADTSEKAKDEPAKSDIKPESNKPKDNPHSQKHYALICPKCEAKYETGKFCISCGNPLINIEDFKKNQTPNNTFFTETVNGVSFNMRLVKAGTFDMGANREQPVHKVKISKDYYIGETVVTQKLWTAVMGNNPSKFKGDDLPVECVSWDDAQDFIEKLNRITKKEYRLPTEAEWEHAAREGKNSRYKYSGSDRITDVAWCSENSGNATHPVGSKQSNSLGIFDMSGNVWEWCQDWYGHYSDSYQIDPGGTDRGSRRVNRGGSWYGDAGGCRVAYRGDDDPDYRDIYLGFRLAVSLQFKND